MRLARILLNGIMGAASTMSAIYCSFLYFQEKTVSYLLFFFMFMAIAYVFCHED